MELLRLKKRLVVARKGHKLLKDKQDELMRRFLEYIQENKRVREDVEKRLSYAYSTFLIARGSLMKEVLEGAIASPYGEYLLEVKKVNILNLKVPQFKVKLPKGTPLSYGFIETCGDLDNSILTFFKALPSLIKLAEIEKSVAYLADEIERTRRRVNALEYILIPNLEETIRYINIKLTELERSNLTRLMKVKDLVGR